jgi:Carbohydrate binding domain (family 25).
MRFTNHSPSDNIISIEMPEVKQGEIATVNYKGQLTNQNNGNIYLHYGFDGWKRPVTVPMDKLSNETCTTNILVKGNKEINICFKDESNCWDNNNGNDYRIKIE